MMFLGLACVFLTAYVEGTARMWSEFNVANAACWALDAQVKLLIQKLKQSALFLWEFFEWI
ncbi:Uncharacterized protein ChrSV_0156 [Chromobacterium vaccinii]|nr:Uncharacterized protein ChrSW_0156 [Chromobacterium vaccinii]QND87615.1 Uncharacterized protein ChrSV_0156 [Chromobacterium vaccinii]